MPRPNPSLVRRDRCLYARLSTDDRRAIVEILRETKPGLPEYFR